MITTQHVELITKCSNEILEGYNPIEWNDAGYGVTITVLYSLSRIKMILNLKSSSLPFTSQPASNFKCEHRLEVVQYQRHSWRKYWQAKGLSPVQKFVNIEVTQCVTFQILEQILHLILANRQERVGNNLCI
ncbi:hypothetical protein RclHR1_00690010 [Rhizophagus clarus]|uniref:Uncharacterized protein n=1 Tax=Rhizophagus clarus TaxID=94130 RepID=A0A2Z6SA76_9GLOM|nr:hypothetical protein RclHR1_00690010 [Rhizophagus clarus]